MPWTPTKSLCPNKIHPTYLILAYVPQIYVCASGIECTLSKFSSNTKLRGVVSMLEGRAIQRDQDRLEVGLYETHEVQQGQVQGSTPVLGQYQAQAQAGREWIESSPEKNFGVLMDERLDMSQQYELTAQKAKSVLGCIQSSVASRMREGILPLCSGETPLGVQHPALRPQQDKDMDLS
ncbi:hypothetical protein DUI87_10350 [Hirundo rustica rustica]|uniref:Uncharacterized protein n=1 Tax=Hirundo rustica rustica TaxID=333673 RepID=A0A3M0KIA9_HIRRU|nr:hypothetical protein DUI87_10350 [Hirundo rustica rustica]